MIYLQSFFSEKQVRVFSIFRVKFPRKSITRVAIFPIVCMSVITCMHAKPRLFVSVYLIFSDCSRLIYLFEVFSKGNCSR